jgi:protein TonB
MLLRRIARCAWFAVTVSALLAAQTVTSPSRRVRISQGVSETLLVKRVEPQYPQEAKDKGLIGNVVLQAHISAEGDVEGLTVVSGDELLVAAAVEAVRQWKYKPYKLNGEPVAVETYITVVFRLPSPHAVLSRMSATPVV